MKKKIPENWETLVEDWNTTTPDGNYEICTLKRWKKMGLKNTLFWLDDILGWMLLWERKAKAEGRKTIRY